MKLRIDIHLGTRAMSTLADVATALDQLAVRLREMEGVMNDTLPLRIRDANGVEVGTCNFVAGG